MSQNWKTYKLGDLAQLGDGAHSKVNRIEFGVPYLTSKNFKRGKIDRTKVDYISESDYNRLFSVSTKSIRKPQFGDIILGIIGTLGNAYLYCKDDYFGISSSIAIIRPDKLMIDPKYLYYYITSREFKHYQNAHNGASVQGYTNLPSLRSIPIRVSKSLKEQRAIASILSAIEDKIELNLQMNRTLEDMAQTLYKHWFVDFGPFKNGEFIDSELGEIPKGWEVKSVKELVSKLSKGTTPKKVDVGDFHCNIPFLKVKNISNDGVINDKGLEFIPELVHKNQLKRSILEKDDILFSIAGTIGRVSIVPESLQNSNCNQALAFIRLKDIELKTQLYYFFKDSQTQSVIYSSIVQGVQANVSLTVLNELKLVLAPEENAAIFNNQTGKLFNQIQNNIMENQTLTKLRDTLLPKLISGAIRVKDAKTLVAETL